MSKIIAIYFILMLTQYIPLEGCGTSTIKVAAMCVTPFLLILNLQKRMTISPSLFFVVMYLGWVIGVSYSHPENPPRVETLAYSAAFWIFFFCFHSMVCSNYLKLEQFYSIMKGLLWAYMVTLLLQQLCSAVGLGYFPLINNYPCGDGALFLKCRSLSIEPSHAARIMICLFFGVIKSVEIMTGEHCSFASLWKKEKKTLIFFIISMLSICSATAFLSLLLLIAYLSNVKKFLVLFFMLIIMYELDIFDGIENKAFQRFHRFAGSIFSGDTDSIIEADHSASFRIVPMLNVFKLDFSDIYTWIGRGTDITRNIFFSTFDVRQMVGGGVAEYGVVSLILIQIFVFSVCIRKIFCFETLIFFVILGGALLNVAYGWGIMMIFTCIKYYTEQHSLMKEGGADVK